VLRAIAETVKRKRPINSTRLVEMIRIATAQLLRHRTFTRHVASCTRCARMSWCPEGKVLWEALQ
jgi:hypothetical protein